MREILFRGKRLDNGEWAEGSLIHFGEYCCILEKEEELHPVDIPYLDAETGLFDGHSTPVDPATVGQYTGLKDKNGNRIFEGDIIDCWSEGVRAQGAVQQNKGGLWIIYPAWQKRVIWGLCPDEDMTADVEIVGNIHDNPELLKGGAEGE